MVIKESAVLINRSGRTLIGVGCIEVCSGMWESVWIVSQEKDDQVIGLDQLVIYNRRNFFRL